jgi:hypothetical protein
MAESMRDKAVHLMAAEEREREREREERER